MTFAGKFPHAAVLAALGLACSRWHAQPLPSPASPPASGGSGFRAGMARIDITPPPGVGLGGSGPEGRRSTGYRTRLYAGALVLEDGTGERIALVVADLPTVSANLHRLVASRLVERWGIGADRLVLSATHTHSGPSHFYGERQYNANVSRVGGYDPRMVELLVSRIDTVVGRAAASLRRAQLAWGKVRVTGATWNRSLAAYCANSEAAGDAACLRRDSTLAVDDTLVMLRVDAVTEGGMSAAPMGSYSVFALHGTALPSLNTLLDGDLHTRVMRRLQAATGTGAVHLLANGAEGDVAPTVPRDGCDLPRPGVLDPVPMPRGPGELVDFVEPTASIAPHCVTKMLDRTDTLSAEIAAQAADLYRRLGSGLGDVATIRRRYRTEWLPGRDGLCGRAEVGSSTAAGAEGLETRVRRWKWLFFPLLRLGLEEGGSAVRSGSRSCQAPKRTLLGPIQAVAVVGEHGFPETAQLTVLRIDSLLFAAVPAEVTTMEARRLRRRIAVAAGGSADKVVVIGLANGYLQYVTTREEYGQQHYEGGSVLYGPGTGEFLERRMAELADSLLLRDAPSPPAQVAPITAYPGPPREIMAVPGQLPEEPITSGIALRCDDRRLVASWIDLRPGRVLPRSSPWVAIEREDTPDAWVRVAEDGDHRLELSTVRARGDRSFEWRAEWRAPAPGRFRVVRLADATSARRESPPSTCR